MVLAQQEVKLTICFYENPAAKQEIKFWEGLVEDKIKSRLYIGDEWSYHLVDGNKHEMVLCIPTDDIEKYTELGEISKIADDKFDLHNIPGKLKYHKTLIFGKVNSDQLRFMSCFVLLLEKGKWY